MPIIESHLLPSVALRPELPRVLSTAHATSVVIGIIIGSGIFLVPRAMMAVVGSSRMVYAVWITGACFPSSAP